jgi:hypothetical protein
MTRSDAQLLYDWLCNIYGNPESERAAVPALASGDDSHKRNTDAERNGNRRVRRNKNPAHDQGNHRAERWNPHHGGND